MKASTTLKTLRVIGDISVQIDDLNVTTILNNPGEQIQDIHLSLEDLQWNVFRNKVIVQGTLAMNILYKGVDGIVYHQPEAIDFQEDVEVPGLVAGLRLPHKVIVPVQSPQDTIDVQIYTTELDTAFNFTPPFTLNQVVLARILIKVSRIEQHEVFINGVHGIFRFNNPITRS